MSINFYGQLRYKDPTDIYRDFNDKFRNKYLKEFYEMESSFKEHILIKLSSASYILLRDIDSILKRKNALNEYKEREVHEYRKQVTSDLVSISKLIAEFKQKAVIDSKEILQKYLTEIRENFSNIYRIIKDTYIEYTKDNSALMKVQLLWLNGIRNDIENSLNELNGELIDLGYEPIELYEGENQ